MTTTTPTRTADAIRDLSWALATTDPTASLDDLEPLGQLIGDARVVAIGESAHHGREFYLLRHRLARFLVERMGFDVYALEAPFTASRRLDAWIQNAADDGDINRLASDAVAFDMGRPAEFVDLLRWLRGHNERASHRVALAGLDVPGSGGSPQPALEAVRTYLASTDSEAGRLADRALELVQAFDAPGFAPQARYAQLDTSFRNELTAILSQLLARLESTRSRHAAIDMARAHAIALHDLRGAWYLDHFHRDLAGAGFESSGGTNRDVYMAESTLRVLDETPGRRVILAAHNWHIQRTVVPGSVAPLLPTGYHLAQALGDGYRSIGLTAGDGSIAQIDLDPADPLGYRLTARDLPEPAEDSIELAFRRDEGIRIADLRPIRRDPGSRSVTRIRMEHYFMSAPVVEAFDAIAYLPMSRIAEGVPVREPEEPSND